MLFETYGDYGTDKILRTPAPEQPALCCESALRVEIDIKAMKSEEVKLSRWCLNRECKQMK